MRCLFLVLVYTGSLFAWQSPTSNGGAKPESEAVALLKAPGEVVLYSRDSLQQAQHETPLGDKFTDALKLNGTRILTRGEHQAEAVYDPASGLLLRYTDMSGVVVNLPRDSLGRIAGRVTIGPEAYQVTWAGQVNAVTITPLNEPEDKQAAPRPTTFQFDGLGRLMEVARGGEYLKISRDARGRPTQLGTSGRTINFRYEGDQLTQIGDAHRAIFFSDHDQAQRPQKIAIDNLAVASVAYGSGGRPQSVSFARKGGLAETWNFNSFGDVTGIERPGQAPVHYTLNSWGMPASMAWKGETFNLFGEKDNLTWNLPAGLIMTLNERGNVTQLDRAGQGRKTYEYDGGDRLVKEKHNGAVRREYSYTGYRLKSVSNADEVVTLERDAEQRVTGYTSDVRGNLGGMTYDDAADGKGRLLNYIDPNGVTTEYGYDADGWVTKIDIKNGPTFIYQYDIAGNITHLDVGGLSVAFTDYQGGLPGNITWERRGKAVMGFTVSRNPDDRLDKIEGGGYLLDLTWDNEHDAGVTEPKIIGLTRQGPDFSEVWNYSYDSNGFLSGASVTRGNGDQITENYTPSANGIPTRLERVLNGLTTLDLNKTIDEPDTHVTGMTNDASGAAYTLTYDALGNLTDLLGANWTTDLDYDAERRMTRMKVDRGAGGVYEENHNYDYDGRRSDSSGLSRERTVYVYHNSRVIAIGTMMFGGAIRWSHAIGQGPLGPVFMKDLSGKSRDVFIFTDHLGTPFAYRDGDTGAATYTPFSPWGELLAETPGNQPYAEGVVPTAGFNLATDGIYPLPPIGLAGHLYEPATGLVYMHHRYYAPRLGHFLTPDFRPMDIYEPSTFIEPYAYAAGNPVSFWDPDGLQVSTWVGKDPKNGRDIFLQSFSVLNTLVFLYHYEDGTIYDDPLTRTYSGREVIDGLVETATDPKTYVLMAYTLAETVEAIVPDVKPGPEGLRDFYLGLALIATPTPFDDTLLVERTGSAAARMSRIQVTGESAALKLFPRGTGSAPGTKISIEELKAIGLTRSSGRTLPMEELLAPYRGRAGEILTRTRQEWSALDGWQMMTGGNIVSQRTVFRWMSRNELELMSAAGRVLPDNAGMKYILLETTGEIPGAVRPGSVLVQFDVPADTFIQITNKELHWGRFLTDHSTVGKLLKLKGNNIPSELPGVVNIKVIKEY